MKQIAWLYTAQVRKTNKATEKLPPRAERMKESGLRLPIPNNPAPHLTDWLFDIGPVVPGGMGMARIGWQDIAAWQSVTGHELAPWEASLLRSLSGEYLAMQNEASDPQTPAPWIDQASVEANREAVTNRLSHEADQRRRAREFLEAKKGGR